MNKKKSMPARARQEQLMELLAENPVLERQEICQRFDVSKNTLTGDLKKLAESGYEFAPWKRSGKVVMISEGCRSLTLKEVRRWLILFLLVTVGKPMSTAELKRYHQYLAEGDWPDAASESYAPGKADVANKSDLFDDIYTSETPDSFSLHTLTYDLQEMTRERWLICEKKNQVCYYQAGPASPIRLSAKENICKDFLLNFESLRIDQQWAGELENVWRKLYLMIYDNNNEIESHRKSRLNTMTTYGRLHTFTGEDRTFLEELKNLDYQHHVIRAVCKNGRQMMLSCGKLFYSVDKNGIYLLYRNARHDIALLKASSVKPGSLCESEEKNDSWNEDEICQIYQEMFAASFEQKQEVSVLFYPEYPALRSKVEALHMVRPGSSIRVIEDLEGQPILYRDTVRGLADFAKYLRKFGSKVVVQKPETLRSMMIRSAEKILRIYREDDDSGQLAEASFPGWTEINSADSYAVNEDTVKADVVKADAVKAYAAKTDTVKNHSGNEIENPATSSLNKDSSHDISGSRFSPMERLTLELQNLQFRNTSFFVGPDIEFLAGQLRIPSAVVKQDLKMLLQYAPFYRNLTFPDAEDENSFRDDLLSDSPKNLREVESQQIIWLEGNPEIDLSYYLIPLTTMEYEAFSPVLQSLEKRAKIYSELDIKSNVLPLSPAEQDNLEVIQEAIAQGKGLRIRYKSIKYQREESISIMPRRIVTGSTDENRIHIISSLGHHYRLDRIIRIERKNLPAFPETGVPYYPGCNYDYYELYDYIWGSTPDDGEFHPVPVKLIFDAYSENVFRRFQGDVKRRKYGKLQKLSDRYYLYTDLISGIGEFRFWVREYGSSVKVLEPRELAGQMVATAQEMLERYKKK